ncbi:septum formation family protein [Dactylosporangium vinaceum]|uniref:Septum formation family protein n=1 Tax=Dactylosporangium vinaceum TaxID=53362 RepID=A0ABV5MLT7_9ACTN|nr:septum formation family protein [Dactylosporangium vinaceum]UAB96871.1 septum formation family protein [Dactylosporangium vinaceum]
MKRAALIAVIVVLVGGGLYWMYERGQGRDIPDIPAAGTPTAGTCYKVDADGAKAALPWPGEAIGCGDAHTVELYHIGQVPKDLLHRLDDAKGEDVKVVQAVLYAQARRVCVVEGPAFLGGDWHAARVQIVAAWIKPATDGFYGCGVATVTGPAGDRFTPRAGSLKGALAGASALAAACIADLQYVECTSPHDGEYAGVYTITPPEAPFDEAGVKSAATRGCTAVGLTYLGLPANADRADLSPAAVGPKTANDWLGSDQAFTCYLMSAKPLRSSVRNLGTAPLPLA